MTVRGDRLRAGDREAWPGLVELPDGEGWPGLVELADAEGLRPFVELADGEGCARLAESSNVAVTTRSALMVRSQDWTPEQSPLQPKKVEPLEAVAVRVT